MLLREGLPRRVVRSVHLEPPRSDRVAHPARFLLHPLRPVARRLFRLYFDVRVVGGDHVPASGPVILASNHVGLADGPLLAIFSPRPVHALTKIEMFHGFWGHFLRASGQISLDRFNADPAAIKVCLRVLREGGVIGIFPEGRRGRGDFERFHLGAAYLAMVSGAPVVPVVQIGTRDPGSSMNGIPKRGTAVDLVYGEPFRVSKQAWPRTREQVMAESVLLREHMQAHLALALQLTGRELPGELPAHEFDDDPQTGVDQQGEP